MARRTQALLIIELLRFSFRKADFVNAQTYFSQIFDQKHQLERDLEDSRNKEGLYKSKILELQKCCERLSEVEAANAELKASNAALDEDVGVLKENLEEANLGLNSTVDAELEKFQRDVLGVCGDDGTTELKSGKDLRRRFGDISMVLRNKIRKLESEAADSRNKMVRLNEMLLETEEKSATSLENLEEKILILEEEKERLNCRKELEISCLKEKLGKLEEEVLRLKCEKKEKENVILRHQWSSTFEDSGSNKKKRKKNIIREGDFSWSPLVLD